MSQKEKEKSAAAHLSRRSRPASAAVPLERSILLVRGQRVILDSDLAELYGVSTRVLNQAVSRNSERFPKDFAFQLSREEFAALESQLVIAKSGRGGRRTPPWAFTEHGAIMAASVLRSKEAVQMSVYVVRAFVKLRTMISADSKLAGKLAELERRIDRQDGVIVDIVQAMQKLLQPPEGRGSKRRIGFVQSEDKE